MDDAIVCERVAILPLKFTGCLVVCLKNIKKASRDKLVVFAV